MSDEKSSVTVGGTTFHLESRYEFIKKIGHGAYGVVISAVDRLTNQKVAIKKIPKAFEDLVDAKRIVREIKLLGFFDHDNIVSLLDI
jgi:mitogen-activated protein kinase 1/3